MRTTTFILVAAMTFAAIAGAARASSLRSERETEALSALRTIAHATSCDVSCAAAYRLVAEALPGDRSNALAKAILATPNFDYDRLGHALDIPSVPEIKAQWRAWCNRTFPGSPSMQRVCFKLILGPPGLAKPTS